MDEDLRLCGDQVTIHGTSFPRGSGTSFPRGSRDAGDRGGSYAC